LLEDKPHDVAIGRSLHTRAQEWLLSLLSNRLTTVSGVNLKTSAPLPPTTISNVAPSTAGRAAKTMREADLKDEENIVKGVEELVGSTQRECEKKRGKKQRRKGMVHVVGAQSYIGGGGECGILGCYCLDIPYSDGTL